MRAGYNGTLAAERRHAGSKTAARCQVQSDRFRECDEHLIDGRRTLGTKHLSIRSVENDDGGSRTNVGLLRPSDVAGHVEFHDRRGRYELFDLGQNGPGLDAGITERRREEQQFHWRGYLLAVAAIFGVVGRLALDPVPGEGDVIFLADLGE